MSRNVLEEWRILLLRHAEGKAHLQIPHGHSSSAEAVGYAVGSGAREGLFFCAVARELRRDLKMALHSDSTATVSQDSKMGLGHMKHVELRFLFVKDLLNR